MTRTRDILEEIAQVRNRRQFGSVSVELSDRLFSLEKAFAALDGSASEISRYFPVALVACIEGFARMAIKELIDRGDPYLANAEKIASQKIDFATFRAIHGKVVTVGELVAHGVSLSRLDHLDANLSQVLGFGFLNSLRTVKDRWLDDRLGEANPMLLSDPNLVFTDVIRTFELRHIICHEIASAYPIHTEEVKRCFESCAIFLRAADELISQTLHPGPAPTQRVMNDAAWATLNAKKQALADALLQARGRVPDGDKNAFDDAQEKWQSYCDTWGEFIAGDHMGSIRPLLLANAIEDSVSRRLEQVSQWRRLDEHL